MRTAVSQERNEALDRIAETLGVRLDGSRALKVPPSRWIPIYEARRAGKSRRVLAQQEGCSQSWIRLIIRAVAIERGTYSPDDWMQRSKEMKKEGREAFREMMDDRTAATKREKEDNQALREGRTLARLAHTPSMPAAKTPRGQPPRYAVSGRFSTVSGFRGSTVQWLPVA